MTVIRYSPWKLLGLACLTAVPAALFMWMLVAPDTFMPMHGRYAFLVRFIADNFWACGGLFALTGGVTALALGIAFGDRTALAIGAGGIEVRTIYRQYRIGWGDVLGIGVLEASRSARRAETLVVRVRRDGDEKVLRISTGLLEQSRPEIDGILETAGRPAAAPLRAREPVATPAMDHDAAIARHLAGRQGGGTGERAQLQATMIRPRARGGFGRKGL